MGAYFFAGLVFLHHGRGEDVKQRFDAAAASCRRLHDRHAERGAKLFRIHTDAVALRLVLHVEVEEQRDSLL